MTWQFRFVAHSEIGLVRKNNQDSGYATPSMLVVADGMGGAAAGDLASAAAIDRIRRPAPGSAESAPSPDESDETMTIGTAPDAAPSTDSDTNSDTDTDTDNSTGTSPTSPTEATDAARPANPWATDSPRAATGDEALEMLAGAILRANDRLADLIADDHSLDGMGTTVSAVMLADEQYAIGHIGDSRAYLYRDGKLIHLTHDHSWVQSLVDEGRLTDEEAAYHPHRSLLLRVLNGQPQHEPDLELVRAQPGDRLLVCSDGLCGFVPDEVLADRLANPDAKKVLADLVSDAHAAGGADNITIIIADLVDDPDGLVAAVEPVVLGAASERTIPELRPRPVDLGDHTPETRTDADGNPVPNAPTPKRHDDPEADRYAPREAPPRLRRWGRALLVIVAAVLLVGGAGVGTWAWARTQYFVAPNNDQVGIFRGLNEEVGSWQLNELYEAHDIDIADLPAMFRDQLSNGISADSLDGAQATVTELRNAAETCRRVRAERATPTTEPPPTPTPDQTTPVTPAPSGTPAGPSVRPTPGASPTPSAPASPTVTPTPSATPSPSASSAPKPFDETDC